jgi:hypothetical protein
MEVDLGEDKRGELALREAVVFVEGLTACSQSASQSVSQRLGLPPEQQRGRGAYISLNAPATSVQTVSMSSLSVRRAKTLSSGSSSARKPRTPVAETRPGIVTSLRGDGVEDRGWSVEV